jgi:hypothetical protein
VINIPSEDIEREVVIGNLKVALARIGLLRTCSALHSGETVRKDARVAIRRLELEIKLIRRRLDHNE